MNIPNIFPQAVLGDCVCLDTCWIAALHSMYASKFCKISPQLSFLFLEKLPDASLLFCKTSCILPICFPPCFPGGKLNVGTHFKYSLNILDRLEVMSKGFPKHGADEDGLGVTTVRGLVLGVLGWSGAGAGQRNLWGMISSLHTAARRGISEGFSHTSW